MKFSILTLFILIFSLNTQAKLEEGDTSKEPVENTNIGNEKLTSVKIDDHKGPNLQEAFNVPQQYLSNENTDRFSPQVELFDITENQKKGSNSSGSSSNE